MKILALDTALPAVSACVYDAGTQTVLASESLPMERGHAETLLPLVHRVMDQVEGGFDMIERVAVTVGPGSFTGIRVALSAARAFGLALDIPVVGVSTLAAFAAPLVMDPRPGTIVSAIDARHGQVYMQACASNGAVLVPACVAPVDEVFDKLGFGTFRVTGSAAAILALKGNARHLDVQIEGETLAPQISFVARLGALAEPTGAPPSPLYIKPPDVKPPAPFLSRG